MSQLDLFSAAQRRNVGMQRAADHADRETPDWRDQAYEFLLTFARANHEFLSEDFVEAAVSRGIPKPPDGRAWGAIVRRAAVAGAIRRVGAAPARTSNCSLKPVWSAGIP